MAKRTTLSAEEKHRRHKQSCLSDYYRVKAMGKCWRCKGQAEPGTTQCADCRARHKGDCKKQAENRKAKGQCRECSNRSRFQMVLCQSCADLRSAQRKQLRRSRARNNLCKTCGLRSRHSWLTVCWRCHQNKKNQVKAQWDDRIANGMCPKCGQNPPVSNFQFCSQCAFKVNNARRRLREIVINGYGARCNCCGETIFQFLTLDHVNNDGAAERKQHHGEEIYKKVARLGFPSNYQVLCYNCNCSKGQYGACPHTLL